ncbi:MAG TPA: MarR family transcriptional regulator [Alphaproteobacteria bacterium]|nr:MarR family transcriptional regulator [Alphaproteobacteria bacterium]
MEGTLSLPLDAETRVIERPRDHKNELRLWLRLFSCKTLVESEIRRRLREEFEMTLPRFDLMAQLDKAQAGMKLSELSQRLMVSNGNVTGLVDRLVEQGSLERKVAPDDGRAQLVTLTAEGRRQFRIMAAAHAEWIAALFADLAADEIETLMNLLGKAKSSARAAIAAGGTR